MGGYVPDDRGAISLIPEDESAENETDKPSDQEQEQGGNQTPDSGDEPEKKPGFEAEDNKKIWSTQTEVELFHVSYTDDEQNITVESVDGTQIIAPGTHNTYVFKLKNTGNVALDYTVDLEAFCTPADILIPVNGRVCRYDGEWVVGGENDYPMLATAEDARDTSTLGAGCYAYYTLDWVWPYENDSDEHDTMLGNLAGEQELTFTIRITTTATESADPNADGGLRIPQTGDNTDLVLLIVIAASSFVMMILLIIWQKKDKRRDNTEAGAS